jgi:hypothetical protein
MRLATIFQCPIPQLVQQNLKHRGNRRVGISEPACDKVRETVFQRDFVLGLQVGATDRALDDFHDAVTVETVKPEMFH